MFGTKYALHNVGFDCLVEQANQLGPSPLLRAQGFLLFVSQVLGWFETSATLESIKVVAVVKPEVNNERDADIRLRHHIKLTKVGIGAIDDAEADAFLQETLPYKAMSNGVFELTRSHSLVQQYLALPPDNSSAYHAILQSLAREMNMSFGHIFVYHDFGLASA